MAQFVSSANHSGNPQDDYNKIQNVYPHEVLVKEAAYVLEEQSDASFKLAKKPKECKATDVTDVWGFIEDKEKVLIIKLDGTFHRFNFEMVDLSTPAPTDPKV